jgi:hypothetical protein
MVATANGKEKAMENYSYFTETTVAVNFSRRSYVPGTRVAVLSKLVHDGVCLVRFPMGEETYLAGWRLENPPQRASV